MTPQVWSWFPDWWLPNAQTFLSQISDPSFDPLLLLRYALQALLTSLPVFLADYCFGLALLTRLRLHLPTPLKHASALALGSTLAALALFLFGFFGRLTFRGLLIFTLLEGLIGLALCYRHLRLPRPRLAWLWAIPILLFYLPDLMLPILEYDSTMYHMASARHYIDQQKILYHDGIRFNAQPHMPVMLYLRHWWLTGDANLIKLVNLEYLFILAQLFLFYARRYHLRWGVLAAAGFVFGSPIFSYSSRQEYADFALTTWLAAGVTLMLSLAPRRLLVAGLILGAAAASKLQGLLVVGCFLLADSLLTAFRTRALPWRRALTLGLPVLAVSLPWWWRGWRSTGSPFYPFLSNSPDTAALFKVNAGYGVGHDFLAFLSLPWHMITIPPERYADLFRFGPSLLLLLLIAIPALFLRRTLPDRSSTTILAGSLLFTLFWFRSGQVMRYEACLLPLWAILLFGAWRSLRAPGPALALLTLPLFLSTALLTSNLIRYGVPPPVTWPATQSVLNAVLPYYRATLALRPHIRPGDKTYTWFCDDIRAYTPGLSFGDWFGGYTYTWLGDVNTGKPILSTSAMLARLRQNGFRFVIVDRQRAERGGTIYGQEFLASGLVRPFTPLPGAQTIFDDGRYWVFRLP